MNGKIISVGSVTYAMKAKDILFTHGIKAYIEKKQNLNAYGCGYVLKVNNKADLALKILDEYGIKVNAVTDL